MHFLKQCVYCAMVCLAVFAGWNNTAIADDWECEGIQTNIPLVNAGFNRNALLSGRWVNGGEIDEDCGIISSLVESNSPRYLAFAIQQNSSVLRLELNLDVSRLQASNFRSATFAAVEVGSGSEQSLLLELLLRTSNDGADYIVEVIWYEADAVRQIDELQSIPIKSIDTVLADAKLDIELVWLARETQSDAQVSVIQTQARSHFSTYQTSAPSLIKLGVIESSINGRAGSLWIKGAELEANE